MPEDIQTKWKRVGDELPPAHEHFLLYDEYLGVCRGYRDENDENPSWHHYPLGSYAIDGYLFRVKYWMNLPEAPKNKE